MMGYRTVAGDSREQATNFTNCPDFWNVFKLEAAVYPIDDEFNMCSDNAFYKQSDDESINCANTERVGYFFITVRAILIIIMYTVFFVKIFVKRTHIQSDDTKYKDEFEIGTPIYLKNNNENILKITNCFVNQDNSNDLICDLQLLDPLFSGTISFDYEVQDNRDRENYKSQGSIQFNVNNISPYLFIVFFK